MNRKKSDLDRVHDDEISRGRVAYATEYDRMLLDGIAKTLRAFCSLPDGQIQDGEISVPGEALWALSLFMESTLEDLKDKVEAVQERVKTLWPDQPGLLEQALTDPSKVPEADAALRKAIRQMSGGRPSRQGEARRAAPVRRARMTAAPTAG